MKEYLISPSRHPQGNEMGARELAIKLLETEAHVRKVEKENFELRLEKREIASELRNLLHLRQRMQSPRFIEDLRAFAADLDEAGYSYRKKYPDVVMFEMLNILVELKWGHTEKQHRMKREREALESKLEERNEIIEGIQKEIKNLKDVNSSLEMKSEILEKQAKEKIADLLKKQRALDKKHGSLENEYRSLQKEKKKLLREENEHFQEENSLIREKAYLEYDIQYHKEILKDYGHESSQNQEQWSEGKQDYYDVQYQYEKGYSD